MQAKKIFCILVAVCILLTAFPAAAFATDRCACGNDPVIVVPGYTSSSLYLHYGTPQEEQIWNLTAENTLPVLLKYKTTLLERYSDRSRQQGISAYSFHDL